MEERKWAKGQASRAGEPAIKVTVENFSNYLNAGGKNLRLLSLGARKCGNSRLSRVAKLRECVMMFLVQASNLLQLADSSFEEESRSKRIIASCFGSKSKS